MTLQLTRKETVRPRTGPVAIIVLDGVGIGRGDEGDAVHLARTPTLDWLSEVAIHTRLYAHGTHVGMPSDGDMGNSEVGHNALGAGRIFSQGAKLVAEAVDNGQIFESKVWKEICDRLLGSDNTLHLMGLLSDGNVHSHIDHVFALIRQADTAGIQSVRVHILTDGRDVGGTTALQYVDPLQALLDDISQSDDRDFRIASGGGRMFVTMDRYNADWSIVERGWKAHVLGDARQFDSAREAIETFRAEKPDISDQYLPPFVIADDNGPVGTIEDGDAVVFWNFRGDRAIEITRAFEEDEFDEFDRQRHPDVLYAGMMQYDGDLELPTRFLVEPPAIDRTLGEYLAGTGLRQLAISETQKYGHVTYFWNGNRSGMFNPALETYIEVPSDRVDFSQRPWMKAAQIADATIEALETEHYDFVRLNFANGDMVGHTGHLEAAIIAVEAADLCLKRVLDCIAAQGGVALVTADHGNADQMFQIDKKSGEFARDEDGDLVPMTSHTLNQVPLWIYDPSGTDDVELSPNVEVRRLSNLAATALFLMGFEAPEGYDPSLVRASTDR